MMLGLSCARTVDATVRMQKRRSFMAGSYEEVSWRMRDQLGGATLLTADGPWADRSYSGLRGTTRQRSVP